MIKLPMQDFAPPRKDLLDCIEELEMEKNKYGFIEYVTDSDSWSEANNISSSQIKSYQQVAVVGIGGSSQGIKSLVNAISPERIDSRQIVIFDHIGSQSITRNLKQIVEVKETLWCVISKSGSTSETLIILSALKDYFSAKGIDPFQNVVTLTENFESPIAKWAKSVNSAIYKYPENIEGRFSALSLATLLPASLLEIDIEPIRTGALWALNQKSLLAQLAAFYLDSFEQKKWISNFWFYSPTMGEFGKWLEQLWAESLGKCGTDSSLRVSAPNSCYGTNDQHSVLQQMVQGYPDRSHTFICFSDNSKMRIESLLTDKCDKYLGHTTDDLLKLYAVSTYKSLAKSNPCTLMECDNLNLEALGALYMTFQMIVAIIGNFKGIEIYGQPGVEESKSIFRKLL